MIDKKAFYKLSYGLYVVSSFSGDKKNGQMANSVFQITAEPPMLAVSINKNNLTHEYIKDSKLIGISILEQNTPMEFIGKFGFKSGRDIDKFKDTKYKTLDSGLPIVLENTLSYFELQVKQQIDVSTHTIFIGEVVNSEAIQNGEEMTYKYYHLVKQGKAPKTAPTFIMNNLAEDNNKEEVLEQYKCDVCGYIYDPKKGDPTQNIPPNTSFDNLPDNWKCPICGVGKSKFSKK